MKIYKDLGKNSGVSQYEIGADYIDIKFKNNITIYRYSVLLIPKFHIDKMKNLAIKGRGLGTYINHHPFVRDNCTKR